MAKSKRVNLSVPGPLYDRFAELARLTGQSIPAVMVGALAVQASYVQPQINRLKRLSADSEGEIVVQDASGRLKAASAGSGKGSGSPVKLSRQQKRFAERHGGKRGS